MKKIIQQLHKGRKGQAMVETVIISVTIVVLLTAIQFISDMYLIKQKTIVSSRYATWKMAQNKDMDRATLENNINNYFFSDYNNVALTGGSRESSGLVDGVMDFANDIFGSSEGTPLTALYTVTFQKELQMTPLLESMNFPTEVTISSYHEVDGNTWNFENSDVHEGWDLITEGVSGFFNAL